MERRGGGGFEVMLWFFLVFPALGEWGEGEEQEGEIGGSVHATISVNINCILCNKIYYLLHNFLYFLTFYLIFNIDQLQCMNKINK